MNRPYHHSKHLGLISATLLALVAHADWPQFRGPGAGGVDSSHPLPVSWNVDTGSNVLWSASIPGLAHSAPIAKDGRIYVATASAVGAKESDLKVGLYGDIEPVQEKTPYQWRLLALEQGSGRVLWDSVGYEGVPRVKRHPKSSHCNSTPATDGKRIVAILGSEGLFCFDTEGKPVWKTDLGPMDSGYYAVPSAQWGFASSPVIFENRVIVLCDVQTNSFLASYDLASGKQIWRTARNDVPTWGTPAVVPTPAGPSIVVNGWHHSGGYDFNTGKETWRLEGGGDIPVPTPLYHDGLIYLTSAHGQLRPMRAIRPDATGNVTAPQPSGTNAAIAWVHPRQGNYMQTPVVVSNRVYSCADWGVVTCFDAKSGAIAFSERLGNGAEGFTASPVSDGTHIFFPSETGRVFVVAAGTPQLTVVATNTLGETSMATPAIADGILLFHTRTKLLALKQK